MSFRFYPECVKKNKKRKKNSHTSSLVAFLEVKINLFYVVELLLHLCPGFFSFHVVLVSQSTLHGRHGGFCSFSKKVTCRREIEWDVTGSRATKQKWTQPHDHHVRLKLLRATDQNHKPYCFTGKTVRQKLVYDFLKLKFCTRHWFEPALCGSAARLWPPSWYISASLASRRWRGSSWVPSNSPPSS